MKVLFVLPSLASPTARHILRLELLRDAGAEVSMVAFSRGEGRYADHPALVACFGDVQDGHYLRRIPAYFRSLIMLRHEARKADCIIAYGVDLAALSWLATLGLPANKALVLDLLDVRNAMLEPSYLGKSLRILQKFIMARIRLLIVSSPAFVTDYLERYAKIAVSNWMVIENKVATVRMGVDEPCAPRAGDEGVITVGYFGLLRCQRSLDILLEAVDRAKGKMNLYIRGISAGIRCDFAELAQRPNVIYGGEYKSPEDLADMYGRCDIVWSCYPYSQKKIGNWCWARTNRFYEACLFRRPPIVSKGTQDGFVADEAGIGLVLDLSFPDRCIERLIELDGDSIRRYRGNIARLPAGFAAYTDEHCQLYRRLQDIVPAV